MTSDRHSLDSPHPGTGKTLTADEVRLSLFLSPEELERLPKATPRPDGEGRCVLLTGADGFVGHLLLLELLEQFPEETRIVCLVLAEDATRARELLEARYDTDPALRARFQSLASREGRLQVMTGDLTRPRFGLPDEQYQQLASEVDRVLHNAAWVNHRRSYPELFATNVGGTLEVLRFATTGRPKPVAFLSSIAALSGCTAPVVHEDDDLRRLVPERDPDARGRAAGYGMTKWVSELLLRDFSERTGIPVQVFRCSLILGHSSATGQLNAQDVFARVLALFLNTGLASRTLTAGRIDGVPVDTVARCLASLFRHIASESRTFSVYHVTPEHETLGSQVLEWLQAYTGGRLRMLEPEGSAEAWLEQWKARLQALPEPRRKHGEALLSLLRSAGTSRGGEGLVWFDNARFKAGCQLTEVPHLTEPLLRKYVEDLRLLKLVD